MTSALRWAAMTAILNVSLIVGDKVTSHCPQTTTFEDKGEPKRIRIELPLLTSLTPYRWAKAAKGLAGPCPWTSTNSEGGRYSSAPFLTGRTFASRT